MISNTPTIPFYGPFNCPYCNERINNPDELKTHIKLHEVIA